MHEGELGFSSVIINRGSRWRWVVSLIAWLLYSQAQSPWYPLNIIFMYFLYVWAKILYMKSC